MIFDFDLWELIRKGYLIIMCIIILILFSLIPLHIFTYTIKSKNPICDSEKQSKFILDCIKEDKTKTVRAINDCERISIGLYCK